MFLSIFISNIWYFKIIFGNSLNYFLHHLWKHLKKVTQKLSKYLLEQKELISMLKIFNLFYSCLQFNCRVRQKEWPKKWHLTKIISSLQKYYPVRQKEWREKWHSTKKMSLATKKMTRKSDTRQDKHLKLRMMNGFARKAWWFRCFRGQLQIYLNSLNQMIHLYLECFKMFVVKPNGRS